jgi:hypothetical protein
VPYIIHVHINQSFYYRALRHVTDLHRVYSTRLTHLSAANCHVFSVPLKLHGARRYLQFLSTASLAMGQVSNVVCLAIGLEDGRNGIAILVGGDFVFSRNVQTDSGAHPVIYLTF